MLHHFRLQVSAGSVEAGRPAQRLIAYLAVENRSHTRDHVAGCLWPDSTQARATGSLRRVLCLLQANAPDLIVRGGHTLTLSPQVDVDLWRQRLLVERVVAGECTSVERDQLALLRGDLLPDWDDAWLVPVRDELRQLRLLCLEALSVAQLDVDKPHSALAIALYATRDEPLRESAHRLVVQAHLALGNHAAAAQHYADYSGLLWRELRLRPGLRMEALVRPLLSTRDIAN